MSESQGRLALVLLAALTCVIVFGEIILHPDQHMFSSLGDGVKNYFTFAWHVRYDPTWLAFGGMNYPYGEHVGFTDGHALISLLTGRIPFVQNHPVGTLNVLMMMSYPVGMWLVYQLLRRHGVRTWMALCGAWCIVWMSPQLFRLEGHFSLSWPIWIPAILLICSDSRVGRYRVSKWWLVPLVSAAFFIHPYHGMMMALFLASFSIVSGVSTYKKKWNWRSWMPLPVAATLPVVFFFVFNLLTDTHSERTTQTFGFLEHTATPASVFLPDRPPLMAVTSYLSDHDNRVWEGIAYIGFFAVCVLAARGIVWLMRERKMTPETLSRVTLFFLASLPVLFFAFGWPFTWGLGKLLDELPLVKQFRAPGRFAWVFYYTSTLLAFTILEEWWKQKLSSRKSVLRLALTIGGIALFAIEALTPLKRTHQSIAQYPNILRETALPASWRAQIQAVQNVSKQVDYLFPVPFFHYGSDIYARIPDDDVQAWAMVMAYHAGIPLAASALSRASLPESRAQLNRLGPFTRPPPIEGGLVIRPFSMPPLLVDERWLWMQSEVMGDGAFPQRTFQQAMETQLSPPVSKWPESVSLFTGQATLQRDQYLLLLSVEAEPMFTFDREPAAVRIELKGDPVLLAGINLIIQHASGTGVRWVSFSNFGNASGHSKDGITACVDLPIAPPGERIEVALHYPGVKPINFEVIRPELFSLREP